MVELKDLQHVEMIKEAGGIQKAASALGLSQPALTKRLQNLEAKIGLKLFDRQAKGVKLTAAGELFLADGKKLLSHARDFQAKIANHKAGKGGRVAIGIKPGMDDAFFRRSLVEFIAQYPDAEIDLSIGSTPALANLVKSRDIDIAIGALGYTNADGMETVLDDDLEFLPKFEIPIEIFVRKNHPILETNRSPEEIFKYPLISPTPPHDLWENIQAEFARNGLNVDRPQILVDDYSFIYDIVERTDFWSATFVSSHGDLERQNRFEILGSSPLLKPLTIGLVKRKTWSITPAAQNLLDVIDTHAADWVI